MAELSVILVVDDREDEILLIRRALQQTKMLNPVITMRSGEEAILYLSGEGKYRSREEYPLPELVLLDLKMPGMDGFEVLTWIRAQPAFRALRVVVLTSSDQIYDVNKAYELGANSFLVKPTSFNNYVEVLRAMNGYWLWMSKTPQIERPAKKVPKGEKS